MTTQDTAIRIASQTKGLFPFVMFIAIAFAIPIALVASNILTPGFWEAIHGGPLDYWGLFEQLSKDLGVAELPASSLYRWLRLSVAEPIFWTGILYAAAPLIAALVVRAATRADGGLAGFGRRLRFSNRISAAETLIWYLGAFAVMAALNLASAFLSGVPITPLSHYLAPTFPLLLLGGMFFDQGGLLEEGGWRGFALPFLHKFIDSPLKLNILLGLIWGVWHIPRDVAGTMMGPDYLWAVLLPFVLLSIGLGTVIAFFFYRVGGSVWIAVLVHCLSNNTAGIGWGQTTMPHESWAQFLWTRVGLFALIIVAIRLIWGKDLGLRRDTVGRAVV